MLDDLVPVAVTTDGKLHAGNDWGYLKDAENSLFKYFDQNLLAKYPEIKGTIFLPLESHKNILNHYGYRILTGDFDDEFKEFLLRLQSRFEFAFHGVKHTWEDNDGILHFEFAEEEKTNYGDIIEKINQFSNTNNIYFRGGKFPGYRYNASALNFISEANFEWWALDADMINFPSKKNKISFDRNLNTVIVPTNLGGDIFKNYFWRPIRRRLLNHWIKFWKHSHPVDYIRYLYVNGMPITIQEHFQNQTIYGTQQPLNIYDDIWSLDIIYGLLRGLDIWHCTCGEMADYFFNYIHTTINVIDDNTFEILSNKTLKGDKISIATDSPQLMDINRNKILHGVRKNNRWIYNHMNIGVYKRV